jgi:hypothetical protein
MRYYKHNRRKEYGKYVAYSMHVVKKKGIQSWLRKPEQEERIGRLSRIM